jgi:transposase-like protein
LTEIHQADHDSEKISKMARMAWKQPPGSRRYFTDELTVELVQSSLQPGNALRSAVREFNRIETHVRAKVTQTDADDGPLRRLASPERAEKTQLRTLSGGAVRAQHPQKNCVLLRGGDR